MIQNLMIKMNYGFKRKGKEVILMLFLVVLLVLPLFALIVKGMHVF